MTQSSEKISLPDQIHDIIESGTLEEQKMLELAVQSIHRKRDTQSTYISGLLQLKGEFINEHTYQIILPITPFTMNALDIVHGGITSTLVDSTMGSLINQKLPDHIHAVTSEMKVNFIAPGKGEKLISRATLVHMGNHLCVAECRVTNQEGNVVAIANGTFFMFKADKK